MVKNPPAMQESRVQSLGRENPLEEEMATHSSILAWTLPWSEQPGGLQSMGRKRVGHYFANKEQEQSLSGIVWKHEAMSRFQNSSLFFLKEWEGHTIHLRIPQDS